MEPINPNDIKVGMFLHAVPRVTSSVERWGFISRITPRIHSVTGDILGYEMWAVWKKTKEEAISFKRNKGSGMLTYYYTGYLDVNFYQIGYDYQLTIE